jgi:hypothetical protein
MARTQTAPVWTAPEPPYSDDPRKATLLNQADETIDSVWRAVVGESAQPNKAVVANLETAMLHLRNAVTLLRG